ncbi:MAG: hypothetical protein ACYDEV_06410 [Acidiferrobacter sp.]
MTVISKAAQRAYGSAWTLALVVFELIGAALVGLHSRTTTVWPFLMWMACAPWVRLLYLRQLHKAAPQSLGKISRTAYGIAVYLLAAALLLVVACAILGLAVRHMRIMLAFLDTYTGLWGVISATLLLAMLLVLVFGAIFVWVGVAMTAYTEAVVAPEGRARDAVRRGLRLVMGRTLLVVGVTSFQGLLVIGALGAQLFKHSGIALMPMVWPATLFAPVALTFLLALTESFEPKAWVATA